ncbi:MAG: methyltransferase [Betaproteobacteria bacterium]|nr:methyltransferase [Betaproteobacteria bacterium]
MRTPEMIFAAAALTACLSVHCLAADVPATVSATVADKARPAADTERDTSRKPAETLAFAGIKPGMQIAELIPGGGYYTRLLSVLTGPKGRVYALTPPPRPNGPDPTAAANAIATDAHYGNVTVLPLSYTDRALGLSQPVDVVWTSGNYHDIHNSRTSNGMKDFNQRVFEALKSGGAYIVIDHATAAGRGVDDTKTLHRIDPETVKAEVTAVGFRLSGSSDALRNANDPHTAPVFDADIRGKTDQFILKFVKP